MAAAAQAGRVRRNDRLRLNRQESILIWFTGMPGAGKSTLAYELERVLFDMGFRTYVLDDDNVRYGLCGDLGTGVDECRAAARRVAEVGRLFVDAGIIVIAAVPAPFREEREFARRLFRPGEFMEIYLKCSRHQCEKRADHVELPYLLDEHEPPEKPELLFETDREAEESCIRRIIDYLRAELIL